MNPQEYDFCMRDIAIAENELIRMKLYPQNVIADFYCLPSHNAQAYYALLSKKEDGYELTYIKPHIYSIKYKGPVRMYPFICCREAEGHPAQQGQFIMGIKSLNSAIVDSLMNCFASIHENYAAEDEFILDGVLQLIRLRGCDKKELFFRTADKIDGLSPEQASFLDKLYIEFGKIMA